jgi:hypothetical protein
MNGAANPLPTWTSVDGFLTNGEVITAPGRPMLSFYGWASQSIPKRFGCTDCGRSEEPCQHWKPMQLMMIGCEPEVD